MLIWCLPVVKGVKTNLESARQLRDVCRPVLNRNIQTEIMESEFPNFTGFLAEFGYGKYSNSTFLVRFRGISASCGLTMGSLARLLLRSH